MVDAQATLAGVSTPNSDRYVSIPGIPGLQPAMGGAYPHQPGIDLVGGLYPLVRVYHSLSTQPAETESEPRSSALGLGLVGLITTEYFIGYEFIRLGVLLILEPQIHFLERAKNALRGWLHYLALWLANAAWLAVYYRSGSYHSYSISAFSGIEQPGVYLLGLLKEAVQTITTAGFLAWWQAPNLFSLIPQSQTFRLAIGLFVLCFAGLTFFRTKLAEPGALADSDTWAGQAIGLGLIAILAGRLPSWVAGLPFVVQFDYDRFFISIMLGASSVASRGDRGIH